MGGIVDRHSDRASSDEVSEKPWWSYTRQRNDRKCAATVGVQYCTPCTLVMVAIHDAMTSLTGKHHTTSHQHC